MGRRSVGASPAVGGDPDMMRLVAELYYLRDHSQPEIADVTGFSVSKVSRLLAQAREQIQLNQVARNGAHRTAGRPFRSARRWIALRPILATG